jgi:hypothetical protein
MVIAFTFYQVIDKNSTTFLQYLIFMIEPIGHIT